MLAAIAIFQLLSVNKKRRNAKRTAENGKRSYKSSGYVLQIWNILRITRISIKIQRVARFHLAQIHTTHTHIYRLVFSVKHIVLLCSLKFISSAGFVSLHAALSTITIECLNGLWLYGDQMVEQQNQSQRNRVTRCLYVFIDICLYLHINKMQIFSIYLTFSSFHYNFVLLLLLFFSSFFCLLSCNFKHNRLSENVAFFPLFFVFIAY